jgi:type II secretory pathway component PulM
MLIKPNISKLKQKLKDWNRLLDKLPEQQRRWAWLGLGGLGLVLIYLLIIGPLLDLEDSWSQELGRQTQILAKYQSLAANRKTAQEAVAALNAALTKLGSQFLTGDNSAVASSELQDIMKSLAREHGLELTSTKTLPPREVGKYLEVPVQVTLAARIDQVLSIFYKLEHHKKLLFISELQISAPRQARPDKEKTLLQINMVISGVIPKGGRQTDG